MLPSEHSLQVLRLISACGIGTVPEDLCLCRFCRSCQLDCDLTATPHPRRSALRNPADCPVQHANILACGAAVRAVCVQPHGWHRRERTGSVVSGHRDDKAHPRACGAWPRYSHHSSCGRGEKGGGGGGQRALCRHAHAAVDFFLCVNMPDWTSSPV
jgi:hypothetical protein